MSKSLLISIGTLFLAFVSGIGVGVFIGGVPSPSDGSGSSAAHSSSPKDASISETQAHNALLESRVAELEKELDDQKKEQDAAILADRLALFKRNHTYMNVYSLDQNLKVTPAMVDVLNLSRQEQQTIEQHLAQIQEETQKLEDGKMVLTKQSADGVTYEIPPYPEGKEIKAKLNNLIAADIGDERGEFFMNSSQSTFMSEFSNFGEQKTQLEITRTDLAGTYSVKESYLDSNGNATWSMSMPKTSALPARWQKLIQLDPGQ